MPKAEPDSKDPIFGKFDSTNEKLLEQRERARALYKYIKILIVLIKPSIFVVAKLTSSHCL